jgi:hypothetical protein
MKEKIGGQNNDRGNFLKEFAPIKTRRAGQKSWNRPIAKLAKKTVGLKAISPGLKRAASVKRFRSQLLNVVTSRLSYLRKVWPNTHNVAMMKAARGMQGQLDRKVKSKFERIWK